MANVLIIGASSGIGKALVTEFIQHGHKVGALARRVELMDSFLAFEGCRCGYLDINAADATERLRDFMDTMGRIDICIITAGVGHVNNDLDWEGECRTIETNVLSFSKIALYIFKYFQQQDRSTEKHPQRGHLVGIGSIAGIKGLDLCPAYSGSKRYTAIFLQSLRRKSFKERLGIRVTTVIPGFVDTDFIANNKYVFWMVPVEKAARQIYRNIIHHVSVVYVSKRWGVLAAVYRCIPNWLFERI